MHNYKLKLYLLYYNYSFFNTSPLFYYNVSMSIKSVKSLLQFNDIRFCKRSAAIMDRK